jgi:hypothetical protein
MLPHLPSIRIPSLASIMQVITLLHVSHVHATQPHAYTIMYCYNRGQLGTVHQCTSHVNG